MRNVRLVGSSPRTGLTNNTRRMLEFITHEQVGAADEIYETGNTGLITSPIVAEAGTTTNWWATPGYFTPSGDQHFRVGGNAALMEFLSPCALRERGKNLGVIIDFVHAADPTAAEEGWFDVNRSAGAAFEVWEIKITTAGAIGGSYHNNTTSSFTSLGAIDITSLAGTRIVYGMFMDLQASVPRGYGIIQGDQTTVIGNDFPSIQGSGNVNVGFTLFGRASGTTPFGATNSANANSSGVQFSSARCIEFAPDEIDVFYAACLETYRYPKEHKLRSLAP